MTNCTAACVAWLWLWSGAAWAYPPMPTEAREPIPGDEIVRLSVREAKAGRRFTAMSPWRIEIDVPRGVSVPGRGLPDPIPADADARTWAFDASTAVVELELPIDFNGTADEERLTGSIGSFDPPIFCPPGGEGCAFEFNDDGMWRAWRIRTVPDKGTKVAELQLGRHEGGWGNSGETNHRVVAVWMGEEMPPLDHFDRIVFTYVGDVPGRATDWLDDASRQLRPRVRLRTSSAPPAVRGRLDEDEGWLEVPPGKIQGLELTAHEVASVEVVAPLDVEVGVPFEVRVTTRDAWRNPSRVDGKVRVTVNGEPVGVLTFADDWQQRLTYTAKEPGSLSFRAEASFEAAALHHWTRVSPAGSPAPRRLVGDVHIHSGVTGGFGFVDSWFFGDHFGNFTRGDDALRWLYEVEGYDFGALSEHAWAVAGWRPPAGKAFDPFRSGGACAVQRGIGPKDFPNWWTASQRQARTWDAANPGFIVFPAFEWHGNYREPSGELSASLHRIVLFKHHDAATPDGLPVLPARDRDRPVHCLIRYLDASGRKPTDTLVIPHMMDAQAANLDWDLTYRADPVFQALVSNTQLDAFVRIGEMFSARAYRRGLQGEDLLSTFEGGAADPEDEPWTFRYGWRDTEAVLGVIGSSDTHSQMPGTDDPFLEGRPSEHKHEPTGSAFVLIDRKGDARDGIFESMRARRTYATSGIRAWLDFGVRVGSTVHRMGSEVGSVDTCKVDGRVELMVGRPVRAVEVWAVEVGSDAPYRKVFDNQGANRERVDLTFALPNPTRGRDARWMYYLRAFTGEPVVGRLGAAAVAKGHEDVVWSSPIWIDWKATDCR